MYVVHCSPSTGGFGEQQSINIYVKNTVFSFKYQDGQAMEKK